MANILFLGGGRRVELANRFKERSHTVFSYELSEDVPIADSAYIIKGFEWKNPDCFVDIKSISKTMDLIIPLQDEAVLILADLGLSKGVIPSYSTARTCFDKLAFQKFMLDNFSKYYPSYVNESAFVEKPRFGFGSKNIEYKRASDNHSAFSTDIVTQRLVKGKEYSVDAYFNKSSAYVDSTPRERIRVSGGEVISSVTVEYAKLQDITKQVGEKLKLVGPTNFQFIVENGNPFLIEINSRFGGGSTLSINAGLDLISLIERDWLGKEYKYYPNNWIVGMKLERSYRDHFYNEHNH